MTQGRRSLTIIDWPKFRLAVREQLGGGHLTSEEAARRLGLGTATMARFLTGRPIAMETAVALCLWMERPITDFLVQQDTETLQQVANAVAAAMPGAVTEDRNGEGAVVILQRPTGGRYLLRIETLPRIPHGTPGDFLSTKAVGRDKRTLDNAAAAVLRYVRANGPCASIPLNVLSKEQRPFLDEALKRHLDAGRIVYDSVGSVYTAAADDLLKAR